MLEGIGSPTRDSSHLTSKEGIRLLGKPAERLRSFCLMNTLERAMAEGS